MISSHAIVSPQARLGEGVAIGPFSIVHGNVTIGSGSRIDGYCEIGVPTPLTDGAPLVIGAHARIRSHSVLYGSTSIGDGFECGHRVTVRERARIGYGVRIGTLCDIQGDCAIGDHARLHSSVFVAKLTVIRDYAWILPRVVLTNDPTPPSEEQNGCIIDSYAVVAACATVMPGITVGRHALVAAHACVTRDVPPGMVAAGVPSRVVGPASAIRLRGSEAAAYPWTRHFHRGYPDALVRSWLEEEQ